MKKLAAVVGLFVVFAATATAGYLFAQKSTLETFGKTPFNAAKTQTVEVVVPRGTGPRSVSQILVDKGIIGDPRSFYRYLRYIVKKAGALKAGDYDLSAKMTPDEVITVLETGRKRELRFTIPEGLRKEEIADIIAQSGVTSRAELLKAMNDAALIKEFGVPSKGAGGQKSVPGGMEGYLYPDTYQFAKGTPAKTVLRKMRARLNEVVNAKMKARLKEMGWTLHKALTLAAIVEKETGQPSERPQISRVFHNRMRLGMKMQTDPTVIYGIKNYKGNIHRKDLLTPRPYNTYTIKGLPPGPIASPGKAAIEAALWPADGDALFFVSRNNGTHVFCPTLSCHNKAVKKWQVDYFRKKRRGG